MACISDRWHKSRPLPGEETCEEHGRVPSAVHGNGDRWQLRWRDEGRRQQKRNFRTRADAEWNLRQVERLDRAQCLIPACRHPVATEPPVLLCADHRDLLIRQCTRRRPNVHDPIVYFIRNGERVKIGWTTNLKGRLNSLTLPASAVALQIDGGPETETGMHARFSKARVGRTEWFKATPDLERFIASRTAKVVAGLP